MEGSHPSQEQHDAVTWFKKSQLQSVICNGVVPEWFHGIISRKTAEELLVSKPPGYFLIRVSESRIGYTLSYRADDRCRHFMIDVLEDGRYIILGEDRCHRSLQDLVDFHHRTPIMPFCQVLTVACGQSSENIDYAELLFPQRLPTSNTRLPPNNSPSMTPPVSQEDVPPAIPYRPENLDSPTVLLPNSQPNRLYPRLEDGSRHVNAPLPATPVPKTRKRYDFNQPPEVPSRNVVPVKQNQACIRTVSAPDSPSTSTASQQPAKNQEGKPSVVTNLKNFKKKFQKNRSTSQDNTYAEINAEAADRSGNTESEYEEITGDPNLMGSPFSYTDVRLTDEMLPQEYLKPPPFAPGF
ncbi:hematopoietic SH2 domain-containing protein homolog [Acanthochromis polyacanthus]|uniref:hematopoietic SH2 domain-containing protein homolog n=1 Tax=Acanthochromis polyacanthus TaxID=80966 RepID=UPI000B8F26D1|nr:hematopoietic SH2 domain-containing protein homolog [Acanthochromis polyacanthus]